MVNNETLKIIKQRRSVRGYKPDPVPDDVLAAVLEAGTFAPNAGDQAWHFAVVQNKALLNRLDNAAKEAARHLPIEHLQKLGNDDNFHCLYGAPVLVVVSGSEKVPVPMDADCAAANENLLIAAESLGLGSCWIFFVLLAFQSGEGAELRKELEIPEGYKPFYSAILGYRDGPIPQAAARKPGIISYIK